MLRDDDEVQVTLTGLEVKALLQGLSVAVSEGLHNEEGTDTAESKLKKVLEG